MKDWMWILIIIALGLWSLPGCASSRSQYRKDLESIKSEVVKLSDSDCWAIKAYLYRLRLILNEKIAESYDD